jgi:hypothetical protein
VSTDIIETSMPDLHNAPLGDDVQFDDTAYARVFRQIGTGDGPVPVSAFNSSSDPGGAPVPEDDGDQSSAAESAA